MWYLALSPELHVGASIAVIVPMQVCVWERVNECGKSQCLCGEIYVISCLRLRSLICHSQWVTFILEICYCKHAHPIPSTYFHITHVNTLSFDLRRRRMTGRKSEASVCAHGQKCRYSHMNWEIHKTLIDVIQINILFLSLNKFSIFASSIKHIIPFKDRKLHLNGFRLLFLHFIQRCCCICMRMFSDGILLSGHSVFF